MALTFLKPEPGPASPPGAYRAAVPSKPAGRRPACTVHPGELVALVRARLDLDDALPDQAILACLRAIGAHVEPRERWRAAFESNVGHWLALKGCDLNTALNTLTALAPRPSA